MKFADLDPTLLKAVPGRVQVWETASGADIARADGVVFLCPKCKEAGKPAPHSIMCWTPKVAAGFKPPGRWSLAGTGLGDVTFDGIVTTGCGACFAVRNGEIVFP